MNASPPRAAEEDVRTGWDAYGGSRSVVAWPADRLSPRESRIVGVLLVCVDLDTRPTCLHVMP
jgi:hypothetical protein